jgi:hypothetical protein
VRHIEYVVRNIEYVVRHIEYVVRNWAMSTHTLHAHLMGLV